MCFCRGGRGANCSFDVVSKWSINFVPFTKQNVVKGAREREMSLRRQDEAVRSANEARNALENLVYATRSVRSVCSFSSSEGGLIRRLVGLSIRLSISQSVSYSIMKSADRLGPSVLHSGDVTNSVGTPVVRSSTYISTRMAPMETAFVKTKNVFNFEQNAFHRH